MNKKSLIGIFSICIIILSAFTIYRIMKSEEIMNKNNIVNISSEENNEQGEVTDTCIDEWDDYNRFLGEKVEEASNSLLPQDIHYLLKNVKGYINVFYIDENNEEILYKKTDISTDYLSEEDMKDLRTGIEVVGIEALNKMLEDFE